VAKKTPKSRRDLLSDDIITIRWVSDVLDLGPPNEGIVAIAVDHTA